MATYSKFPAAFVVAVAIAAATTACSTTSSGRDSSSSPSGGLTRALPDDAATDSRPPFGIPEPLRIKPGPLDAYVLTAQERAGLRYAAEVLIARCMQDRGFHYAVPKFIDELRFVRASQTQSDSRIFGIVDVGQASVYGYGEPPAIPDPRHRISSDAEREALADDLLAKAAPSASTPETSPGSPEMAPAKGCLPRAREALTGVGNDPVLTEPLAESLKVEAYFRAAAKPAFFAVQEEWGDCMRAKGYDIANPAKPGLSKAFRSAISARAPGEPAAQPEINLALADIECKQKVDLVQRLMALINDEAATLAETNALALDEQQDAIQRALKDASRLIEGSASGEGGLR